MEGPRTRRRLEDIAARSDLSVRTSQLFEANRSDLTWLPSDFASFELDQEAMAALSPQYACHEASILAPYLHDG